MAENSLATAGFFIGREGNARGIQDPGCRHVGNVEPIAKYVALPLTNSTLIPEGSFYETRGTNIKTCITAIVAGLIPWGKPSAGF